MPKAYRSIRYLAPNGTNGKVNELEFYNEYCDLIRSSQINNGGSNDCWKAFDGDTTTSPSSSGNPADGVYIGKTASDRGGAFEYAIILANELNEDLWINVPALADEDFITKLAQHGQLAPQLRWLDQPGSVFLYREGARL